MICLSCTGKTLLEDLDLIAKNKHYIDIAEIRADFLDFSELKKLKNFPTKTNIPCILTFRLVRDGGKNNKISIEERNNLLLSEINSSWTFIDVEDDMNYEFEKAIVKKSESNGVKIIKSFHDFSTVPENLAERMIENSCGDRFIPKAAVMPQNSADLIKIIKAHNIINKEKKLSQGYSCRNTPFISDYILVGMGNHGLPSRILARVWGSMLSYCSVSGIAAPGHIGPYKLHDVYNYHNITKKTKVFGIIGHPVMHSKSPQIHNKAFKENKIDSVYLPFETEDPENIIHNADMLNLYGLSVTSPHKQTVINYLSEMDNAVKCIKACNTMIKTNGWIGKNTDWTGFLKPIEKDFNNGGILNNSNVLVIGAGGAARAIIYALSTKNTNITIANRSIEKSKKLANIFNCKSIALKDLNALPSTFDMIVQTTSVGMNPNVDKTPIPGFNFKNVKIAYDLIYSPEKTIFLKDAELSNCRIINGLEMLKSQAAEQFQLFI